MFNSIRLKVALFLVVAVATVIASFFVDQYERVGPGLLKGEWKVLQSGKATARVDRKGIHLFSSVPNGSTNTYQEIDSNQSLLLLSADILFTDVISGEKNWHMARLVLAQHDGERYVWTVPHVVVQADGTKDWEPYSSVFKIMPWAKKIRVRAELLHCKGRMALKNVRLYPVQQTKLYEQVSFIILVAWGSFFILLLTGCLTQGGTGMRIAVGGVFIAILLAALIPGEIKGIIYHGILSDFNGGGQAYLWFGKLGHFCGFACFGLMITVLGQTMPLRVILLTLVMLAGGTECAQLFVDGRGAGWIDFGIDLSGGIVGILCGVMIVQKITERKLKIRDKDCSGDII